MEGREAAATMGAALEIARKGAADADEAANNMKNFIAKVMSPETLKKAKKNFNLDLYKIISDAQKKGENPFEASMMAIMKATKGDQKAIGELFQDMQVQNFLRPMIQNWDRYKEIKKLALAGDGTVDRDFEKVMATSKEQIDKVGGALGRFFITLGGVLSQTFGGKGGLAERIDGVTKWIDANRELVGTIAKVAVGFFGARMAVLGTMYVFNVARGVWIAGALVLSRLPAVLGLVATGVRLAGTAVLWLGRALMLNPIGLLVTAIGVAAYLVYKNWDLVKRVFIEGNPPIQFAISAFIGMAKLMMDAWRPIGEFFRTLWEGIVSVFKFHIGAIMKVVEFVADKVKSLSGGLSSSGGGVGTLGGSEQYDAMGNFTGFTPAAELPKPAMATSKAAAPTVNDNSQTTFNITAPPGTTAKEVADEVEKRLKQKQGVERRSIMFDGAG